VKAKERSQDTISMLGILLGMMTKKKRRGYDFS
jgi:hypothetical protein